MSDKAAEWLEDWSKTRVMGAPFEAQKRQAKETYAPACIQAANQAGFTRREIEAAAGGNLIKYFEGVVEDKWDVEVRKNLPKA